MTNQELQELKRYKELLLEEGRVEKSQEIGRRIAAIEAAAELRPSQSVSQTQTAEGNIPTGLAEAVTSIATSIPANVAGALSGMLDYATYEPPLDDKVNPRLNQYESGLVKGRSLDAQQDSLLNPSLDRMRSAVTSGQDVASGLTYEPRTEMGQRYVGNVGSAINTLLGPVQEFIQGKAQDVYKSTASPSLGAATAVAPGVAAGLLPVGAGMRYIRSPKVIEQSPLKLDPLTREQLILEGRDPSELTRADLPNLLKETDAKSELYQQRMDAFKRMDVPPTRAQITRDASDFARQQELAKQGSDMRGALEEQTSLLTARNLDELDRLGGNPESTGTSVYEEISARSLVLDDAISSAYTSVRNRLKDDKVVKLDNLMSALKKRAGSELSSDGAVGAVVDELKAKGVLIKDIKDTPNKIDAETAEDIRIAMNSFYSPINPSRNNVLREFKEALDEDVFKFVGEDAFKSARAAKAKFEKDLSLPKKNKFDKKQASLVRDILENKIPAEGIVKKVVSPSATLDQVKHLKEYLSKTDTGQAAWRDVQTSVLKDIIDQTFKGPKDQLGNTPISRAGLDRTWNKYSREKKELIIGPEASKFLDDLYEIAEYIEPIGGTALGYGPSAVGITKGVTDLIRFITPVTGSNSVMLATAGTFVADKLQGILDASRTAKMSKAPKLPAPPRAREPIVPKAGLLGSAAVLTALNSDTEENNGR